ncbi:MAG: peptidoglycan D,D-transpeptidase FtsI family protein [bacterium]
MKKENDKINNINLIRSIFIGLFAILIINIVYFNSVKSSEVIISPYNPRLDLLEERIIRGKILTRNKEILAESIQLEDGTFTRVYPQENLFAHIIGFSSNGKSGLESYANYKLLSSNDNLFIKSWNELRNKKNKGNNIITTLDLELQKVAYEAIGDNKGAIVAIEPSTGKILSMVSKPDFNPNEIEWLIDEIVEEDPQNTFLLNRATQGLYPPGSTFKILTALTYILDNPTWTSFNYTCNGEDVFYGNDIHCYSNVSHGQVDLSKAIAYSCNTALAEIGTDIDLERLKKLSERFLFNNPLPLSLPYSKSSYVLNFYSPKEDIPETVIGQGKTLITPFHNALISATVANGGIMMKPYIINSVENDSGKLIEKTIPKQYERIIEPSSAFLITKFMKQVVEEGTARGLNELPFTVAGKTGSAEHKKDQKTHAWFIGFAPVENPQIAISILVEDVGTSSEFAIPIAEKMLTTYLR